jgi:hypothetical protein
MPRSDARPRQPWLSGALSLCEAPPLQAARRVAEMTQGLLIIGVLMLSASSVQAIECRAELPSLRNGHWTYRIIDGRKCWYQGKSMISKSLLHWRGSDIAPNKARALPSPARTDPDLISCCSPPLDVAENFEARWQGIFGTQLPRALFDPAPISEWGSRPTPGPKQ